MNIVFFGSTSDSVLVLEKLPPVVAVVTQPPRPIGRKQIMTPTPVETWAKGNHLTVLYAPDMLESFKADLLVSASYGEKIPMKTITDAKYGGLNVHPSLLPRWRGADPVPWAIISGDHQTGVTIVTLSEKFDQGKIVAQKKIPITDHDTSDPLRTRLFEIGAQLLPDILASKGEAFKGSPQEKTGTPYARRLTRDDGFEPWANIIDPKETERINRKFRAFTPWPGLWTRLPSLRSGVGGQALFNQKRLKILGFAHAPTIVQLEGKKPVSFKQFQDAYLTGVLTAKE